MSAPRRLVVVGGGISGIAAALEARAAGVAVTLLEASDRLGGKVWTEDGLFEWGPDAFLVAEPDVRDLAVSLGLGEDLVVPDTGRVWIRVRGRLQPMPPGVVLGIPTSLGGIVAALRGGILDAASALRAAIEPLRPGRLMADAAVGGVLRARFGEQVVARLVEPLLANVYGASVDDLGLASVLPHAVGARSVVRAMRARPRASGPMFAGVRGGLGRIVDAAAVALEGEDVRTGTAVHGISRTDDATWRVALDDGAEIEADGVVVATTASVAARLLEALAPAAAEALGTVAYSSSAVLHLRYRADAFARPLEGSGYVAVPSEHPVVSACSFVTTKWPHLALREPRLRAFVTEANFLALDDDTLSARVVSELAGTLGATQAPLEIRIRRWSEALPIYGPGHAARIERATAGLPPGIALAGAYLNGLGLPRCIRSGRAAVRALLGEDAPA